MTTTHIDDWDQAAEELDTYYKDEKDALRRAIDKLFRKATTERFHLTLQDCKNIKGKKILDIGCGAGRTAIQLAKRGAHITGVDNSESMIARANAIAEKEDLQDKCTFINDNFNEHSFKEKFDVSIALGFFDYTRDPVSSLKKMSSLTTEKCIMSFSAKFAFQVPLRVIWLRSKSHPVYFYTKKELKRLFSPHFSHYRIKNISAGYHCVGFIKGRPGDHR